MIRSFFERVLHVGLRLALQAGKFLVKIFPQALFISLARSMADAGFYLFRGFRNRSVKNLSVAFGDRLSQKEIAKIVQRSLRNFFQDIVEVGIALAVSPEEIRAEIPLSGREHLEAALAKGKGVMVLSAHLGNFFLVGTRLAVEDYPIYVLVNPPRDTSFRDLLNDYRLKAWQRTIYARPRREASRQLIQVLRRNELAIVIADEYRSGNGIHVPFFGHKVIARRGPATLALRTGAAVVPVYLIRDPSGKLRLIIEPELDLPRSGRIKADVAENTARITEWLERVVRSYPDQWNWMNIRWQKTSVGEPVEKEKPHERFA
jgi:KDO2-lipid IV(A) lauroyltransferase